MTWKIYTAPTHILRDEEGTRLVFVFWRKRALAADQLLSAEILTLAGLEVFISETGQFDHMIPYTEWKEGKREFRMLSRNTIVTQFSKLRKLKEAAPRVTEPSARAEVERQIAALESILKPYSDTVTQKSAEQHLRELEELMERHGLKPVGQSPIANGIDTTKLLGLEPPPDFNSAVDDTKKGGDGEGNGPA